MELGFWIPIVSGILDSVFRIPKPRISDSINKNLPDSRIRIPLHGTTPHCFETALQSGDHMNPDKK